MNAAPTIKAIPTTYNGTVYRSRLEARWAILFDGFGMPFDYEPEGYNIDGTMYLPDFWLPSLDVFFEVKPTTDISIEMSKKYARLALATGKVIVIGQGVPGLDWGEDKLLHRRFSLGCAFWHETDGSMGMIDFVPLRWRVCPGCGAVSLFDPECQGWEELADIHEAHRVDPCFPPVYDGVPTEFGYRFVDAFIVAGNHQFKTSTSHDLAVNRLGNHSEDGVEYRPLLMGGRR